MFYKQTLQNWNGLMYLIQNYKTISTYMQKQIDNTRILYQ